MPHNNTFSRLISTSVAAVALAGILLVTSAKAAPINYGNLPGATVDYLQVTEDAVSAGDAPPLFGAPTVTGDSIDFDPVGFDASSQNGGADITDGNLKFTIDAHAGKAIKSVTIAEAGDVTLLGIAPLLSETTFASVVTRISVDIDEVDGNPISVVSVNGLSIPFAPSGGTYGLGTDGAGGPLFTAGWNGSLLINVNAILTANGVSFVGGATRVDINLDNILTALSQQGTSASIAKKNANGVTITVNIPEPTGGMLALLAGSLAAVWRRRG